MTEIPLSPAPVRDVFGRSLFNRVHPRLGVARRLEISGPLGAVGRAAIGFGQLIAASSTTRAAVTVDSLLTRSLRPPMRAAYWLRATDSYDEQPESTSRPVAWTSHVRAPDTPQVATPSIASQPPQARTVSRAARPVSKVEAMRQLLESEGLLDAAPDSTTETPTSSDVPPFARRDTRAETRPMIGDRGTTSAGAATAPGQLGRRSVAEPESTPNAIGAVLPNAAALSPAGGRQPRTPTPSHRGVRRDTDVDAFRRHLQSRGLIDDNSETSDDPDRPDTRDTPVGPRNHDQSQPTRQGTVARSSTPSTSGSHQPETSIERSAIDSTPNRDRPRPEATGVENSWTDVTDSTANVRSQADQANTRTVPGGSAPVGDRHRERTTAVDQRLRMVGHRIGLAHTRSALRRPTTHLLIADGQTGPALTRRFDSAPRSPGPAPFQHRGTDSTSLQMPGGPSTQGQLAEVPPAEHQRPDLEPTNQQRPMSDHQISRLLPRPGSFVSNVMDPAPAASASFASPSVIGVGARRSAVSPHIASTDEPRPSALLRAISTARIASAKRSALDEPEQAAFSVASGPEPSHAGATTAIDDHNPATVATDVGGSASDLRPARPSNDGSVAPHDMPAASSSALLQPSSSSLADRFLTELSRSPGLPATPLATRFHPIALAINGPQPLPKISADAASRRALRSVGRRAATIGDVIHVDRDPVNDPNADAVIAHELTHVAHPSERPRFLDDEHRGPEERLAEQVAAVIARSPVMPRSPVMQPSRSVGSPGSDAVVQRMPQPAADRIDSPAATRSFPSNATPGAVQASSVAEAISRAQSSGSGSRGVINRSPAVAAEVSAAVDDGVIRRSGSWSTQSAHGVDDVRSMTPHEFEALLEGSIDFLMHRLEDRMLREFERRGGRHWRRS